VCKGNRGIVVYTQGVGTINIPWNYFERIDFTPPPQGPTYNDYVLPSALRGSVTDYTGEQYEGQLMYDRDEIWDIEVLDGNDDDIQYEIPFRYIARVVPKNRSYSLVYLRNGQDLLLGDAQDVSNNNDGVTIVNNNRNKPITIDWDDIDEVIFD